MSPWIRIQGEEAPQVAPNALLLFYAPDAMYVWATSGNFEQVLKDYANVSHYRIISEQPA